MPNVNTLNDATAFQLVYKTFSMPAVAASQTNVNMKVLATDATSGTLNIARYSMPYSGSLVSLSWSFTAAVTAGTFTLTPTINGTAITDAGLIVNGTTTGQFGTLRCDAQKSGNLRFTYVAGAAPAFIGLQITTSGTFAPTTSDLLVELGVLLEGIQL